MVRNVIGGVVLLILLGVVGFVYYDRFGKKPTEETASNTNSGNPPSGPPTGPPSGMPGSKGPQGPRQPGGPGNSGPKQPGQPNPYTGEGVSGGQVLDVDAFVYAPYYGVYSSDEWTLSLSDEENGIPVYQVYLRPEQQTKVNDLWAGQSVKIRGRQLPRSATDAGTKVVAAEIVSIGAPPKFVEMTVDQLLKEFQDGPEAAKKKWKKTNSYDPPWIKLTGTFDGASPDDVGFPGIQLKGTDAGTNKPNRVFVDVTIPLKPLVKGLKPGQQLTVRVRGLNEMAAGQVRFTTGLFPFQK